ncbi:MAG TPA: hypothetical protein VNT75_17385 [Symbiobacteriaceae bacterium]|nr:hypothetical protein [Symbiobacteriaceae bacterium]
MGARAILTEMRDLLKTQVDAVVAGEHQQVSAGAFRHEELLRALETAELDASPEELRELAVDVSFHKEKLASLLESEGIRLDFLLRLVLGGGAPKPGGYPANIGKGYGQAGRINRRT